MQKYKKTKYTPQEFEKLVKAKSKEIKKYAELRFPTEAGNTALRFVDGNFRAQGWQGASFKPWKPNQRGGTILVKSGHLRSASYYVTSPAMAIVRNTMPYARIHNEGGTIIVPITKKMKKFAWAMYYKEGKQDHSMWKGLALTKKNALSVKIAQRQFAPTQNSPSPVLNRALTRKIEQELQRMFNAK